MAGAERELPRDEFSSRLRELGNHPGAVKASSRVDLVDDYGNLTTWTIDSFAHGGDVTAFVQRMAPDGALRLVLPPKVLAAIQRQRTSQTAQARRRGARQAVETKRATGQQVGNPDALRKARKAGKR